MATITILVKDRKNHAPEVNQLLTENGHLVLSRLGLNVQKNCIENCTAIIAVIVEAGSEEIEQLMKQLNGMEGIVAKDNIMTE